jgi:hypothetical protein
VTALLQARRRGGKGQRLLYFFRTPPAIRVGRGAIDEDAIRLIEEYNPDVQFDWPRILKQAPEIRPADGDAGGRSRSDNAPNDRSQPDRRHQRPSPQPREHSATVTTSALENPSEPFEQPATGDAPGPDPQENREAAVFQRLGSEALARLRARYAEIKARIAERQMDEPEREELKARAERLNPDGWVTNADVDVGLEQYEAVYESVRAVIGHARKRRG